MPAVVSAARGRDFVRVAGGDVLVVPPFECAWLPSLDEARAPDAAARASTPGTTRGTPGLAVSGGSVSFEARGRSDITVLLKSNPRPGSAATRRLDHWSGARVDADGAPRASAAASSSSSDDAEHTYLVILGSHRNSCLVIEKDGRVCHRAPGAWLPREDAAAFAKFVVAWTRDGGFAVAAEEEDPREDRRARGRAASRFERTSNGTRETVLGARRRKVHAWRDPDAGARDADVACVGLSTWDAHSEYRILF